jgi:hypothetical protein
MGPGEANYDAFRFFSGLRPSEAIALRVSDYDRVNGALSITKARVHGVDPERQVCVRALAQDAQTFAPALSQALHRAPHLGELEPDAGGKSLVGRETARPPHRNDAEGARECDIAAIRRTMGDDPAPLRNGSATTVTTTATPASPLAWGEFLTGAGTKFKRLTIRVRLDTSALDVPSRIGKRKCRREVNQYRYRSPEASDLLARKWPPGTRRCPASHWGD